MQKTNGFRLAVDIGGTFTDTVLANENGAIVATAKTPTTQNNPSDAAFEGAQRVMAQAGISFSDVSGFIHGTTLATNALIEKRGAKVATITTAGFRDILEIALERRYSQYDINIVKPDLLVPRSRAFTISERMDAQGRVLKDLDTSAVSQLTSDLKAAETEAVAICLLHAYTNPSHEIRLRDMLQAALPELVFSLSHEISPEAREFDRLCTTIANAYIQPQMADYLADFETRFANAGLNCAILMMTAGGGMTTLATASRLPIRLVESGPAGGAILAARIAAENGATEVLSFDMGGTTAKLCLIDDFRPQTARKFEIARAERFAKGSGMPVRIPVIEMIEIGAGGGSIAHVDRLGRLQVGPESAGSEPGPAAYQNGGTDPTVTDADITQGLIEPTRFAEGRLAVDVSAAELTIDSRIARPKGLKADQAAFGISEIVDENMAAAGRMHAVESGKDLNARLMIAFGGNGPLHATRIARRMQVGQILVPRDPGVGSAVGFLHAPVSFETIRSRYSTLESLDVQSLNVFFDEMISDALEVVRAGAPNTDLVRRRKAFMRYRGQGHEIEISLPDRDLGIEDIGLMRDAFEQEYGRQFSRSVPGMTIEVLNWGVEVASAPGQLTAAPEVPVVRCPASAEHRRVLCDVNMRWRDAAVYDRDKLQPGDGVKGPALITEPQTTTFVSADFTAQIDGGGNIRLTRIPENLQ